MSLQSPDAHSMPSLCSPDGSLPEDDLAFMTLNMEDEMDLRAPYISMSEQDDLPLLISDDLMWGAHPETVNNLAKELKNAVSKQLTQPPSLVPHQQLQLQHHPQQQQQSIQTSTTSGGGGKQSTIDSSLAALLCGTVIIPQQQHPTLTTTTATNQQPSLLLKAAATDHMKRTTQLSVDDDDATDEDHIVSPLDVMGRPYKSKR